MLQNLLRINHVKKIAVLRANALGDFIVIVPALIAIRLAYSDAEIVLLGKPWHKAFLVKNRTIVDRVLVVPVKKGIREEDDQQEDETATASFAHKMQQEQFDIVLNFQGRGIAANPFIKQFGAKYTVGFVSDNTVALDRTLPYYYYQNETIRYIELVQLIGASPVVMEPQINILKKDKNEIKNIKAQLQHKPYVVLHPAAVDIRRMWPLENYPSLANYFRQKNFEVVFTGEGKDAPVVDKIIAGMKYTGINTCGDFSLGGLAALLADAAIVIGADTGPLHLARAVNAPTVGIYWAPNLINWGPVTRSQHRPVVSWNMHCPLCGEVPNDPMPFEPQHFCRHEISFVKDVTVENVIEAAEQILSQKKIPA